MLDRGHDLLTERVVLHRLAIFAGGFMLQAAQEVAADDTIAAPMVVDCIANPIAKPLLITDTSGGSMVRRRLLETTRTYALEKLMQSGEFDVAARRHAIHYLELFEDAEAEAEARPVDEWLANYAPRLGNVRAAPGPFRRELPNSVSRFDG